LTDRYRRQQRRRAVIGWVFAVPVLALFVLGLIVSGSEEDHGVHQRPDPFGYSMTAAQYAALRPGLQMVDFVDHLQQTGLPENLAKERYVRLFPRHGDDVTCSYWEIADRLDRVARVCFSSPAARLVQKLQRRVEFEGESAVSV
jgi:hypothetical protein